MIWHIFKKDARLLWWLAAAVAALDFAKTAILHSVGLFPQNGRLVLLVQFMSIGIPLGAGFTIAALVHQDAIPGVRQDWLVRPIRRRDLLLAKLLFVLLMVQLPILLLDLFAGLADGHTFARSLAGAAARSLYLLLLVDIPFLAFASLTRNLLEAITGGVAIFFGIATLIALFTGGGNRFAQQPTLGTGLVWIMVSAMLLVLLIGGTILLGLQFFRRCTFLSRCLTGAVAVLAFAATFLPWQPAFAIQQAVSGSSTAADAVAVTFNPGLGRMLRDPRMPIFPLNTRDEESTPIFLPLRVTGLPPSAGLQSDRLAFRIAGADGRVIPAGSYPQSSLRALQDPAGPREQTAYQALVVPSGVYQRVKDQTIRLELDYSLTLFRLTSSPALPAVNSDRHMPGIGWCATRINNSQTAVQLRCEQAGGKPTCVTALLEDSSTGRRNPERFACEGMDYGPFPAWDLMPDSLGRYGANLPFRDDAGLAHYPVDGSMLPQAQVVMHVYEPAAHFERHLVIPQIRLGDWVVQTAANPQPSTQESVLR